MSKIIIKYDGVTIEQAIEAVSDVIEMGRVSNDEKQFCYVTKIERISDPDVRVNCHISNGVTNVFGVWKD